tara:strand:- start:1063 stop:1761 length:699 start_codon:yes stop_codon:yes gene_type:complete
MAYGSSFLQGTKGGTYAAGWRIGTSGVVDGGTIVKAGNKASDSPVTNALSVNTLADNVGDRATGSKVIANVAGGATTDRAGVQSSQSGLSPQGTELAFNASATQWVIRGVSETLGGVANTTIHSRGTVGDGRYDNIHGTITDRKIGSKADEAYDTLARPSTQIVPGRTKGTGAGGANLMENPADGTVAVSTEIFPSRSVPGELTYHFGGRSKPTTDEYKAKDAFEAADDTSS